MKLLPFARYLQRVYFLIIKTEIILTYKDKTFKSKKRIVEIFPFFLGEEIQERKMHRRMRHLYREAENVNIYISTNCYSFYLTFKTEYPALNPS